MIPVWFYRLLYYGIIVMTVQLHKKEIFKLGADLRWSALDFT